MSVDSLSMGIQELIETAAPTIASAYALSRAVSIPVMCSSGLTEGPAASSPPCSRDRAAARRRSSRRRPSRSR